MSNGNVDPQLLLVRRQYMQLFEPDFLAWPSPKYLKDTDIQKWLYKYLFDPRRNPRLPPASYQVRVLEQLIAKINKTIHNTEEDAILGELATCLEAFVARGVPSESQTTQENAYVIFTCILEKNALDWDQYDDTSEPTVTILERRHLVSGSRTTGFRTWEGSLHLGSYLLTEAGSNLINGKNVLELGAGTGFLTILSAKHLHASHVTATDGDEGVIETLKENLDLNELGDRKIVRAGTLTWGRDLRGTWVEEDCNAHPYDVILGADITYEKTAVLALVSTLLHLFDMRRQLKVIISSVVRNAETFQTFRSECIRGGLTIEDILFEPKPMRQQKSLFYAAAMPIKILSITRP
ncbi:hypothetical protein M426DRAFT_11511 [Hypoxylon sp. CI-4A]|nr:hypothetical protein M426DRAFT_11511 [Hypoxylon sp. CI-4A]